MPEWILVPCLVALRNDFNRLAPDRDKASDGSVGDAAHADSVSDHNPDETGHVPISDSDKINEVHAIDVDSSGPWPTRQSMESIVQHLLARCRSGQERRLRYIIYGRRIWSASSDWVQKAYAGSNPHIAHAHFSASYDTTREADASPWLEELMAMTEADKAWIRALFERTAQPDNGGVTSKAGRDVLDQGVPNPISGTPTTDGKTPAWRVLADIAQGVKDLKALAVDDEDAIVAGVLDGLTPERLGQAITAAGLTPKAIAEAVPAEVAEEVADILAARLAD